MKQMVCEICESNDLIKQDGVFVCQSCGMKYSVEEAKKLMVEGIVKIDNSGRVKNLLELARRAKEENDSTNAAKYYSELLEENPNSWEARFYSAYYQALNCKVIEAPSMCTKLTKLAETILTAIKDNETEENQTKYVVEVAEKMYDISILFEKGNSSKASGFVPTMLLTWGAKLEKIYPENTEIINQAVKFWMKVIDMFSEVRGTGVPAIEESIKELTEKIQKYNSEYTPTESKITQHTSDSPNRLYVKVVKVGHRTFECRSVYIGVEEVFVDGPDEVGHIGVELEFKNLQGKTIKYISIYVTPFNAVGDAVSCTVTHKSRAGINVTGPIVVGGKWEGYADGLWYNNTIITAKIDYVDVTYIDGTMERYGSSEISKTPSLPSTPNNTKVGSAPPPKTEGKDSSGGCYVATAVYGSYDCPQVWTLRRYRDNTLASTWYGRVFIRIYYSISPTLVKWFGHTKWFKKMWKGKLDSMVEKLQENGVESTPYKDKEW